MSLANLFDPDQFQEDLTMMLASSFQLAKVPVSSFRKMRREAAVEWMRMVTKKDSDGLSGCGVVTLEPYARNNETGVSSAVYDWVFPVACFEMPDLNDGPKGRGLSAYRLCQLVADVGHVHADDRYGTMNVDRSAIEEEEQLQLAGCIGKRVSFHILANSSRTPPCATTVITDNGSLTVSIACATAGASIYYTVDGSWPAPSVDFNPHTNLYSAPFLVTAGTLVRATAHKDKLNCSETRARQL